MIRPSVTELGATGNVWGEDDAHKRGKSDPEEDATINRRVIRTAGDERGVAPHAGVTYRPASKHPHRASAG
jgi:hypothetical protein